jgi:hypothetical protein
VEIIERDERARDGLVQVAFAETREEAALIRGLLRGAGIRSLARQGAIDGPSLGTGPLTRSSRRIYVRDLDADRARTLLAETMVENPSEAEAPEPANAAHLADSAGRRPRDYSLLGAYARAWIAAAILLAIVLACFLVLR